MVAPFLSRFFMGSILLCASMCNCGDDGYSDDTYLRVETSNITTVENVNETYSIGDVLYLQTIIPFELTTVSGTTINLEDLQLEASQIDCGVSLFKQNDLFIYEPVLLLGNQLVGNSGVFEDFVTFFCSKSENGFTNRTGIKLDVKGTYQLRAGNSVDVSATPMFYQLDAIQAETRIDLVSYLAQSSVDCDFTFVVE